MSKVLSFVSLLMLSLSLSCNNDLNELVNTGDNNNISTRSLGDNKYDALGFGYDATGDLGNNDNVRQSVIDIDKFKKKYRDRLTEEKPYERSGQTFVGQDIEEYSRNITAKFSASANFVKLFSAKIKLAFGESEAKKSENSFASHSEEVIFKRFKLNLPIMTNAERDGILTEVFKEDLNSKTPEQIINTYGTHVLIGVNIGGKLSIDYKCKVTVTDKKTSLEAGIGASIKTIFDVSVDYTYNQSLIQNCTNGVLKYKSYGGNPTTALQATINLGGQPSSININDWLSSINEDNSVLIGIPDNHLIPIWEFVSDGIKKNAIKEAIEKYISDSNVYPEYNLYRYYSSKLKSHSYTSNWDEYNGYGPGPEQYGAYYYEFTLGRLVSPYDTDISNKVPLYRYWSDKNEAIFLTTSFLGTYIDNWYSAQYRFVDIIGYACSAPTGEYNKPVYKAWDGYYKSHIFNTDYNAYMELAQWGHPLEGIAFYVK